MRITDFGGWLPGLTRHSVRRLAVVIAAGLLAASCATQRPEVIQTGIASWYGPGFHGKTTANGETFDMNRLTAAHRTLPFDSVVRVTNLGNSRSVDVRINDRGPYAGNRVIDLSREAARRIGMIEAGTARVRLELLRSPEPVTRRGDDLNREHFTVQLESYNRRVDADRRSGEIQGSRVAVARVGGRTYYRVYFGRYENRNDADRALADLRHRGFDGFVKQEEN
jgi:rare lipoprotein A